MAYGLKYTAPYRTVEGLVKIIKFYKVGYTGVSTEWKSTLAGVQYEYGSSDSLFGKPIVPSQAKVGFIFEHQYDLSEFVYDRKTFFCEVVIEESGKVEWSGWVEPWDAQHDYVLPAYAVSLTVSCGLAHLAKQKYVNPNNSFKKTGLEIIQECLAIIGSTLYLRTSTHMKENTFPEDWLFGLRSFEINTARYYDSNGEAMYCDQIISDILNKFNAEILQWDNRWVIRSIVDHATGYERTFYEYPYEGGVDLPSSSWPGTYIINDTKALTLEGGQLSILPPINKYRTEVDLGSQVPFFENGNMVLWNDNGLVGWDFTHMAKGKPGWERFFLGQEGSTASVLKINGKAPGPYEKKRKKKFWQVAIPILTGAVGANLKNKYDDIEPAEWIESPVGKISRGDKNITVSFEYETAPNSSDVLISIRLRSSWKTPLLQRWLNFGVGDSQTQDTFHLIRVAPAEREGLLYVGAIDVSGNPNYPHGAVINYTFIAKGVPPGEVRRIGGPSGIIVENDDLIVVKATNPGGTQAGVGNDWMVINIRNNVKKGTYSVTIPVDRNNIVSASHVNDPLLFDEVLVRFYKVADENNGLGDWYKVFNLNGVLEGFVASDESSQYATTLERGAPTDEEAESINLITGDYNPYFSGSLTKPGSNENTKSWSRRPDPIESLSVYRAMMLDRLCLTTRPLTVFEGDIKILPGQSNLSYLHTLIMADMGNMRMRIVRYSFEDYRRIAKITAIEVKYEEIPSGELRQDSYIPGQGSLNVIPGQGDGYYPTKTDSTNGRISAEDLPPTPEELEELTLATASSRQGVVFSDIEPLVFIVGTQSTESVDLIDYVSEQFADLNDEQEEEDKFDLTTLVLSVIDKPTWVSNISFDSLEVSVTAKAPTPGDYYITLNALEPESETNIEFRLPIQAINKTVIATNLIDATDGTTIGSLPGFYLNPEKIDFDIRVKGNHNLVTIDFIGGGPDGNAINIHQEFPTNYLVTDFTYHVFLADLGLAAEVGIYTLHVKSYFEGALRSDTVFPVTLYDEEFLNKYSAELWDTTNDELLGVIEPDGSSIFKAPKSFDPKSIIADLPHNKVVLSFAKDGEPVLTKTYTSLTVINDAEYDLFGEVTTEYGPAKYDLLAEVFLDATQVYQRLTSWVIADEIVKPIAGIILGSFPANTINFKEIQSLPLNNTEVDLPPNWVIKPSDESGVEFDYISGQIFQKNNGALNEVNVSLYTGLPSFVSFSDPVTESEFPLFRDLNSTDIGSIHKAPSGVRAVFTKRLGGETGKVVEIDQADFAFRVPLNPDDYSGMRYITNNGGVISVVDTNMPKTGRTYLLSEYPDVWSVSNLEFDGDLFDKIRIKAKINLGGADIVLHLLGPDYILDYTLPGPVSVMDDDQSLMSGNPGSDHRRYCFAPDGSQIIIDQECEIEITAEGYLSGVLIGSKTSRFTLAEEVENPPIEDCCAGGTFVLPVIPDVEGTYGGSTFVPRITIDENGRITDASDVYINFSDYSNDIFGAKDYTLKLNFDENGRIEYVTALHIEISFSQITPSTLPTTLAGHNILNAYTKTEVDSLLGVGHAGVENYYAKFTSTGITNGQLYDNGVNVGLGTASPGSKLHITGNETGLGTAAAIQITNTGASAPNSWYLYSAGSGASSLDRGFYISDSFDYRFSIAFGGNVGIGIGLTAASEKLQVGGNIKSSGQFISTVATGTSPMVVSSATKVASLNADLLDDQHGTYYLARANHTGIQSLTPGIGITGSAYNGLAAQSWGVTYGTTAGTAAEGNDIRFTNAGSAYSWVTTALLGTVGKIPKFISGSIGDSIMSETSGRITTAGYQTAADFESNAAPSASTVHGFTFLSGTSLRFQFGKLGSETGSNAGSDLYMARFGDAGNYLGNVFDINRATGIMTFGQVTAGVTPTASSHFATKGYVDTQDALKENSFSKGSIIQGSGVTITGSLSNRLVGAGDITISGLTGAVSGSGTAGKIMKYLTSVTSGDSIMTETSGRITTAGYQTASGFESNAAASPSIGYGYSFLNGSSLRWQLIKLGSESGTADGSDMYLARFDNSGNYLGNVYSIVRSTGILSFEKVVVGVDPTATNHLTTMGYNDGRYYTKTYTDANFATGSNFINFTNKTGAISQWGNDAGYVNSGYVLGLGYITASSTNTLTNKSGNISQWTNDSAYITTAALSGYATQTYVNSQGFITASSANNLTNKTGAVSMWGNDAGYVNTAYVASQGFITASSSNTLTNKGGNISQWTNDSGYITAASSNNLTNKTGYISMWSNDAGYVNASYVVSQGFTTGSGSSGYLPKFTGGASFGNSIVQDFGSSIQINGALQVNGTINLTGGIASNGQMASGGLLWAIADLRVDGTANFYGNVNVSGMLKPTRFRLPRGTEAQMNALSSPEGGEMFYVTTGTGLGIWEYVDGFGWRIFATRVWSSTGVAP